MDAKRNGDAEGLQAIVNIPGNTRRLLQDYWSGKKDGEEVRNALKTTLSYFMMEEMVTQASNNEYMGQDYLDEISEISSHFSKSLDDAPIDQLFDMTLDVLKAQDVKEWISEEGDLVNDLTEFWYDQLSEFSGVLTRGFNG